MPLAVLAGGVVSVEWQFFVSMSQPTLLEDLHIYRGAVRLAATGASLYDYVGVGPFTYPPFAAVMMQPLAWIPVVWADRIWTLGTLLLSVTLAALVVARCPRDDATWLGDATSRPRLWALTSMASILLLTSVPVIVNLWLGQVSIVVTALTLLDVAGVVPRRLRGLFVGVAAALKLTPLIFILYLLAARQWKQAGVASAAFMGASGVGFLFYPSDSFEYWTHLVLETSRVGDPGIARNGSLLGLMMHWSIGGAGQQVLWIVGCLGFSAMALFRSRAHFEQGQLVSAGIVMGCASLVASPISWPHHLVWVVLAGLWLALHRQPAITALGGLVLLFNSVAWSFGMPSNPPELALRITGEIPTVCALAVSVFGLPRRLGRSALVTPATEMSGAL